MLVFCEMKLPNIIIGDAAAINRDAGRCVMLNIVTASRIGATSMGQGKSLDGWSRG